MVVETFTCACQNGFVEVILEQRAFSVLGLNFSGAWGCTSLFGGLVLAPAAFAGEEQGVDVDTLPA